MKAPVALLAHCRMLAARQGKGIAQRGSVRRFSVEADELLRDARTTLAVADLLLLAFTFSFALILALAIALTVAFLVSTIIIELAPFASTHNRLQD